MISDACCHRWARSTLVGTLNVSGSRWTPARMMTTTMTMLMMTMMMIIQITLHCGSNSDGRETWTLKLEVALEQERAGGGVGAQQVPFRTARYPLSLSLASRFRRLLLLPGPRTPITLTPRALGPRHRA
eukprot:491477-Rhodomonas_salina.2